MQDTNKKLTEDNEFLKRQLHELTDFLDVLVNIIKKQNQSSVSIIKSPHKVDESNMFDNLSSTKNNTSEEPLSDSINQLSEQWEHSTLTAEANSQHDVENTVTKENIDNQLINGRNDYKLKYKEHTKNYKSLKERLENIAGYDINNNDKNNSVISRNDENNSVMTNVKEKHDTPNIKEKHVTYIVGDSIVKHIKGINIENKLDGNQKVLVKSYPGATTNCMIHHVKPSINQQPKHLILHTGTNDLSKDKTPDDIANEIVRLASSTSADNLTVSVSGIVPRNDKYSSKVNNLLSKLCCERNIGFISHENGNPNTHLNRSKLHLNKKSTQLLTRSFISYLKKY